MRLTLFYTNSKRLHSSLNRGKPKMDVIDAQAAAALIADGATVAVSESKIEDIPVTRIVMAEAYLRTDRSDKPRRFLCLLGEKNKVLLTFFTAR